MEMFHRDMEGIYGRSANENTVDESSFVYKSANALLRYEPFLATVAVGEKLTPVFNLKDSGAAE